MTSIKIFRPVENARARARAGPHSFPNGPVYIRKEKEKKRKGKKKNFQFHHCDIRGKDLRPEEEMEVVARGGGGGERERGGGGGTRVRFCLSVPVRSP